MNYCKGQECEVDKCEGIKDVIITGYSNVTKEGVVLHLNKKARLRRGNMSCIEFWVSWDKIGESLIEGYTEKCEVSERRELRGEVS